MKVIVTSRNHVRVDATIGMLQNIPPGHFVHVTDIVQEGGPTELLSKTFKEYGELNIQVNNI